MVRLSLAVYRSTLLFLLALTPRALTASCPESLDVLTPKPGQVLSSDQAASIRVMALPASPGQGLRGDITAVSTQGFRLPIKSGPLGSLDAPELASAIWDLSSVPSGNYTLEIQVSTGEEDCSVQTAVPVTVNRAPSVAIEVASCERFGTDVLATFRAVPQDPEGDAMATFLWSSGGGDGSAEPVPGGEFFQYYYRDLRAAPKVAVQVRDARGGTGRQAAQFAPEWCKLISAPKKCSCEGMQIFHQLSAAPHTRLSSGYYCGGSCVPYLAGCRFTEDAPKETCPPGVKVFHCDLGPLSLDEPGKPPRLGWAFEVKVRLTADSDPDACSEGQFVMATQSIDAETLKPGMPESPPAGSYQLAKQNLAPFTFTSVASRTSQTALPPPPFDSALFGADDYAQPYEHKRHDGGTHEIRWLDHPSVPLLGATSAEHLAEFVTFVRQDEHDPDPCWCHFRQVQFWTAEAGVFGPLFTDAPVRLEYLEGNKCIM